MNLYDDLVWRGLIHQSTSPEIREVLLAHPVTCYIGFDPSSDSLHVGSLLQIMLLVRMQRAGHRPIALLGGATGMIGDPSGKSEERKLLDTDRVNHNLRAIEKQLGAFLDTSGPLPALILNNHDWLGAVSLLEFLRDTGKHFSVNAMMDKDSVRTRLTEREQGISYTEFSYMLLQAHDFLYLNEKFGCSLQLGGSDQWGNITAGVELVRRVRCARAFGMTSPLLTSTDGKKLGKTEKGAVWLDAQKTSPYQFYQYWVRVQDADVGPLLRMLTLLSREEIEALEKAVVEEPQRRDAQKRLAFVLTELVHGATAANDAIKATEALFGQAISSLDERTLLDVLEEAPSFACPQSEFAGSGKNLVELAAQSSLCASKSAARKDVQAGAIYINNVRENSPDRFLTENDCLHKRYVVLRKGKKNFLLVRLVQG